MEGLGDWTWKERNRGDGEAEISKKGGVAVLDEEKPWEAGIATVLDYQQVPSGSGTPRQLAALGRMCV